MLPEVDSPQMEQIVTLIVCKMNYQEKSVSLSFLTENLNI